MARRNNSSDADMGSRRTSSTQLAKEGRIIDSTNAFKFSRLPKDHCAQVIGVYKRANSDTYHLKYTDIINSPSVDNLAGCDLQVLYYNEYLEAIKALIHNCLFIGSFESKDLEYLITRSFKYNTQILGKVGTKAKSNTIPTDSEEAFKRTLVNILQTSKNIVHNLGQYLDAEMRNKFAKQVEVFTQCADRIITAIQDNTINLTNILETLNAQEEEQKHPRLF